jgi:glucans biosynthesis protein
MFFFGPNDRTNFDDYRPEVHDSDGLLMINGRGERIWRPIANPKSLQVSAFLDAAPRGFGLTQRNRDPARYQDFEASYEKRPTLWVEPVGDWGRGAIMLIEIPSDSEINDNIVAYGSQRTRSRPAPSSPSPTGSTGAASLRPSQGWRRSKRRASVVGRCRAIPRNGASSSIISWRNSRLPPVPIHRR